MVDRSEPNADYDVNHPAIKGIIHHLLQEGFEVGLHASYQSYDNLDLLIKEKERLERVTKEAVIGVRQHYLHKKLPLTHNLQRKAGFMYDSTVGCLEAFMLKKRWCFPYVTGSGLIEMPILLQDATLKRGKYSRLDFPEVKRKILEVAEKVTNMNGMMLILYHPSSFDLDDGKDWFELYIELIQLFLKAGGKVTNCAGMLQLIKRRLEL
jgi:hypothetical protein